VAVNVHDMIPILAPVEVGGAAFLFAIGPEAANI